MNDWLGTGAAYPSGSHSYFLKGQLSSQKVLNTGEFPNPRDLNLDNLLVNYRRPALGGGLCRDLLFLSFFWPPAALTDVVPPPPPQFERLVTGSTLPTGVKC